jgi:hypothetical protein
MKKVILLSSALLLVAFTSMAGGEHCSTANKKNCGTKKECSAEKKEACATGTEKKCSSKDAKCTDKKASTATTPKIN